MKQLIFFLSLGSNEKHSMSKGGEGRIASRREWIRTYWEVTGWFKAKAERVGFEPTVVQRATTVFETAPINHSGTSPFGWVL